MNTERVLAEVPSAMGTWMLTHGTPEQWDATARAVAISIGHTLLDQDGEGGNQRRTHARLLDHASPAVRAVASTLGCGTRRWTAHTVTAALLAYFELWSFTRLERRLSKTDNAPTAHAA
jgi:hypothetical protein